MTRSLLASTALLLLVSACGDKPASDEPTLDSAPSAVAVELPQNPMVSSINIGLALDDNGLLLGGGTQKFAMGAPLIVDIKTHFVDAGAPLSVRLMAGERAIETVSLLAGQPDEDRVASAHAELPATAELDAGEYRIEVLLGDVSQGIRVIQLY
jgi:hypothetical protein